MAGDCVERLGGSNAVGQCSDAFLQFRVTYLVGSHCDLSVQCFGNVYQRLNLGDQGVHIRAQALDGCVIVVEFLFQAGLLQETFGRDHFGNTGGQFAVLLFQEFGCGLVQRSAEIVRGHILIHLGAELGASRFLMAVLISLAVGSICPRIVFMI